MEVQRYVVSGRVQGVGFRKYVHKKATQLELRGWVRNLSNGRVEVFATGETTRLDELEKYLRRGPEFSNVLEVTIFRETLRTQLPTEFEIRIGEG